MALNVVKVAVIDIPLVSVEMLLGVMLLRKGAVGEVSFSNLYKVIERKKVVAEFLKGEELLHVDAEVKVVKSLEELRHSVKSLLDPILMVALEKNTRGDCRCGRVDLGKKISGDFHFGDNAPGFTAIWLPVGDTFAVGKVSENQPYMRSVPSSKSKKRVHRGPVHEFHMRIGLRDEFK